MILFNDCVSIGDTVLTFPAMKRIVEIAAEPVYIHWTNSDMQRLFPKRLGSRLDTLPHDSLQRALRLSVHDLVHGRAPRRSGGIHEHPTAALYYQWTGNLAPEPFLKPEIEFRLTAVPALDFLLVPFALTDAQRHWDNRYWLQLIAMLRARYPSCTIGVSAATRVQYSVRDLNKIHPDPSCAIFVQNSQLVESANLAEWGVELFLDLHIYDLCSLLLKVRKAAITIDTGPSRLMHAIGRPHVILAHNSVGYDYARYPGATCLWGDLRKLRPEHVMTAVHDTVQARPTRYHVAAAE
jgi:hypothetical protein